MSKTHEYFQQELGMDKKSLKAHPKLSQHDIREIVHLKSNFFQVKEGDCQILFAPLK